MAGKPRTTGHLSIACLVLAAASSATAGPPIPAGSGRAMCDGLTVADFQGVGLQAASKPTANVQDGGNSVYCVYAGRSSATGGIELDVFYPAGSNPEEIREAMENASGELGSALKPIKVAGADDARWSGTAVSGGPAFATIVIRRGSLVFVLGIPAGQEAQAQLLKLAETALKRF